MAVKDWDMDYFDEWPVEYTSQIDHSAAGIVFRPYAQEKPLSNEQFGFRNITR